MCLWRKHVVWKCFCRIFTLQYEVPQGNCWYDLVLLNETEWTESWGTGREMCWLSLAFNSSSEFLRNDEETISPDADNRLSYCFVVQVLCSSDCASLLLASSPSFLFLLFLLCLLLLCLPTWPSPWSTHSDNNVNNKLKRIYKTERLTSGAYSAPP